MSGKSVLVVDDDEASRRLTSRILDKAGYATRDAASGEEALEAASRECPHLVVVEVCLPEICGYEVCSELRKEFGDELPIVLISAKRTESFDRVAGLLIGADDFLAKPFAPDELLARIRRLIRHATPVLAGAASNLTKRELEVLRLVAGGLGQDGVAERLFISEKTVGTHLHHIFTKLGVRNRAEAVAFAYRERLMDFAVDAGRNQ
jgi:DNA-binding NarL/FixJ family response regulator